MFQSMQIEKQMGVNSMHHYVYTQLKTMSSVETQHECHWCIGYNKWLGGGEQVDISYDIFPFYKNWIPMLWSIPQEIKFGFSQIAWNFLIHHRYLIYLISVTAYNMLLTFPSLTSHFHKHFPTIYFKLHSNCSDIAWFVHIVLMYVE